MFDGGDAYVGDDFHDLSRHLTQIVAQQAPSLLKVYGVGPDVAAALRITVGGNPAACLPKPFLRGCAGSVPFLHPQLTRPEDAT